MAPVKFLNLIAVSTLAILSLSLTVAPANASAHDNQVKRHAARQRVGKRQSDGSCIPKTSQVPSSVLPSSVQSSPNSTALPTASGKVSASYVASSSVASNSTALPTVSSKLPSSDVASSSVSSSAPPAATSKSSTPRNGKGLIAWPNGDEDRLRNVVSDQISAIYTWSPFPPKLAFELGLDFWPMLWGQKGNQLTEFDNVMKTSNATTVLSFNEPDLGDQANLDPKTAADLWRTHLNPLKSKGIRLVSPAPTNGVRGKKWLKDFVQGCPDCLFDLYAVHWYGVSFEEFKNYVESWHKDFPDHNIVITEFAVTNFDPKGPKPSPTEIAQFYREALPWLDECSYVEKYAVFGWLDSMQGVDPANQLFDQNSLNHAKPTELGEYVKNH